MTTPSALSKVPSQLFLDAQPPLLSQEGTTLSILKLRRYLKNRVLAPPSECGPALNLFPRVCKERVLRANVLARLRLGQRRSRISQAIAMKLCPLSSKKVLILLDDSQVGHQGT